MFWQVGFLASLAIQFLSNYENALLANCLSVPCVSNHNKDFNLYIDFKTEGSGLYKDISHLRFPKDRYMYSGDFFSLFCPTLTGVLNHCPLICQKSACG